MSQSKELWLKISILMPYKQFYYKYLQNKYMNVQT